MIVFYITTCLFIMFISVCLERTIVSPPVVYSAVWIASYLSILFSYGFDYASNSVFSCFALALVAFSVGYFLSAGNRLYAIQFKVDKYEMRGLLYFAAISFALFIALSLTVKAFSTIPISLNLWTSIKRAIKSEQLSQNVIEEYGTNFSIILFLVCYFIYLTNSTVKNRRRMILSFMALIPCLLYGFRGMWFMIVIACVFLYLYIERPSTVLVLKLITITAIVLFALFVVSSLSKNEGYLTNDPMERIIYLTKLYFSSSFDAFRITLESGYVSTHGGNTFRFLLLLLRPLGFKFIDRGIVQPFILLESGMYTNVYTSLFYYVQDFGIAFAILVQGIIGIIFGIVQRSAFSNERIIPCLIVLLALLYYPLISSFFDDRFFSIFSSWIQYLFWSYLLTCNSAMVLVGGSVPIDCRRRPGLMKHLSGDAA